MMVTIKSWRWTSHYTNSHHVALERHHQQSSFRQAPKHVHVNSRLGKNPVFEYGIDMSPVKILLTRLINQNHSSYGLKTCKVVVLWKWHENGVSPILRPNFGISAIQAICLLQGTSKWRDPATEPVFLLGCSLSASSGYCFCWTWCRILRRDSRSFSATSNIIQQWMCSPGVTVAVNNPSIQLGVI